MDISAFNLNSLNNTRLSAQGGSAISGQGLSSMENALNSMRTPLPDFSQMLERARDNHTTAVNNTYEPVLDSPLLDSTPVFQRGRAVIDKNSELFEACQELETFLIKTLITSMRNTIQKSELIDTGMAGQFYEDMLYDEYAKDFARNAGWGFAEMAYLELTGQRGKTISIRPDFVAAG